MGYEHSSTDPELVERVQNLQRTDPLDGKLKWMSYSLQHGHGKYDPRAHTDDYILGFFADFEAGNIEIDPQLRGASGPVITNELFIGNLPQEITEMEIQKYFCEWGEIKKIDFKPNRGFCFVTFGSENEVNTVLEHHEEHMIRDQWVDCKKAEDRRKGSSGGKKGGKKGGSKGSYGGGYSKGGGYDSWDGGFSKGGGKKGGNSYGGPPSKGGKKGKGGGGGGYGAASKWEGDYQAPSKGKGSGSKGASGKGYGGSKGWGKPY